MKDQDKDKKAQDKKIAKMNRKLLSKINNILEEYDSSEKIVASYLKEKEDITQNPSLEPLPIVIPAPVLPKIDPPKNPEVKPKKEEIKPKKPKINKKAKKNIGSFMTDIYSIKTKKKPPPPPPKKPDPPKPTEKDEQMEQINNQIDDILNDYDAIGGDNKPKREESYLERNGRDFREMFEFIDGYTNDIKENFDEVKFLIKMSNNAHDMIGRHKKVIGNIFKGAGLKPQGLVDEELEEDNYYNVEDEKGNIHKVDDTAQKIKGYYYRKARRDDNDLTEVFDRLKKINKIKDNISNIQDDFIGYHENLNKKVKEKYKTKSKYA